MSITELVPVESRSGVDSYRVSTDAATVCGEIVKATATKIQNKRYVTVEGWQAIAVAHGCVASSRDVEMVEGGIRAIGEIRRMSDGACIATAEGFLGDDEQMWAKRPMFARRAMAQTRAISRACRSAFAHVVILIDKNLGTTPAEEMQGAYDHDPESFQNKPGVAHAATNSIDEARAEIAAKTGNDTTVYQATAKANAKKWADTAIETLNFASTRDDLDAWKVSNQKALDRLETNHPDQHDRVMIALDNAFSSVKSAAA